MKTNLNILVFASWFPSDNYNHGTFVFDNVRALSKLNKITVLYFEEGSSKTIKVKTETIDNIIIYRIFYPINKKRISRLFSLFKAYLNVSKDLDNRSFDIIHLNVFFPLGILAAYHSMCFKIPLLTTLHWSYLGEKLNHKLKMFHKLILYLVMKQSSEVVAVSDDLSNQILKLGYKRKINVIPNVLNFSEFKQRKAYNLGEKFIVMHVSSLNERKRPDLLFDSFRKFNKVVTNSELRVIGYYNKHEIEKQYSINSEKDNITLVGNISDVELEKQYESCHCFIITSEYETFSIVIAEALSKGLPVVTSLCGGISEWISENEGFVVEELNSELFSKALCSVREKYQCYYFSKIHQKLKLCLPQSISNQYENLLLNII